MNWLQERIDELKKTRQATWDDLSKTPYSERGDSYLIIVHLDMHIEDLERVQRDLLLNKQP